MAMFTFFFSLLQLIYYYDWINFFELITAFIFEIKVFLFKISSQIFI